MTRAWIAADAAVQPALLPVDARDLLPPEHRAFDILAMVDELDLSVFEASYRADGRGRPPFHPRVMLALILYCRSKGILSGRDVAAACYDDLGARMITGNRHPDRSTVDRFVTTHAAALQGLLPQTLRLGHAEGLLDVSVVAGDGTKVLANAAMSATVDEAALAAQIADLEQRLAAALAAWAEQAGADGGGHEQPTLFTYADAPTAAPAGAGTDAAWRQVRTLTGMLHSRQAALAYLPAHPNRDLKDWSNRLHRDQQRVQRCTERLARIRAQVQATHERRLAAEATNAKIPGRKPVPVDEHTHVRKARQALATATARAEATAANRPATGRINTTDPSSRIMPGKRDGFDQRHNIQALACPNQFIIAIGAHHSSNDKQALTGLIHRGRANLDTAAITDPIGTALFDNGYASADNFTADLPVNLLLVAVEKEARQTGRLHDDTSTAKQAWQAMATRFDDPDNRAIYKRRGAIIEPLFAQLFARFGRTLHLRGEHVNTELHLWAATHNLLKISRHRRRRGG